MTEEKTKPPITSAFGRVFRTIRRREAFMSPPLPELPEKMFDALVAAALAKCVEFNIIANRPRKYADEEFGFVSNLRGICEDLITLSYMSKMRPERKKEYTKLLVRQTQADGIDIQEAFFRANNPYQPVYGQRDHPMLGTHKNSAESLSSRSDIVREDIKNFWNSGANARKKGPNVKEMAHEIGLEFTYNYIYFAASNFVHFNPQALMKMGWGDNKNAFRFSVAAMGPYYKSLSYFYGSILFVGFYSAFGETHFSKATKKDVDRLIELIEMVHRWPEVITFEEMNQQSPLYLLSFAMRKATSDGAPSGILSEVFNLGLRLKGIQN